MCFYVLLHWHQWTTSNLSLQGKIILMYLELIVSHKRLLARFSRYDKNLAGSVKCLGVTSDNHQEMMQNFPLKLIPQTAKDVQRAKQKVRSNTVIIISPCAILHWLHDGKPVQQKCWLMTTDESNAGWCSPLHPHAETLYRPAILMKLAMNLPPTQSKLQFYPPTLSMFFLHQDVWRVPRVQKCLSGALLSLPLKGLGVDWFMISHSIDK